MNDQTTHCRHLLTLAAISSLCVLCHHPSSAMGQAEYEVVDLGVADQNTRHVRADSINEQDHIGGSYYSSNPYDFFVPFLWNDGEFFDLCCGENTIRVNAINESDTMTGFLFDGDDYDWAGRVWYALDSYDELYVPHAHSTEGYDVNEAGTVAVNVFKDLGDDIFYEAYTFRDGVMTQLLGFGDRKSAGAYSINNRDWVGGSVNEHYTNLPPSLPVLWINGQMQELALIPSYDKGSVVSLTDDGQTLGYAIEGGNYIPILWDEAFNLIVLGTQGSDGSVIPEVISNAGEIIGNWSPDDIWPYTPVIYQNGEWIDLNTLIDPDSGWELRDINDINSAGHIVGTGELEGFEGRTRAFILKPIDKFRMTSLWPGLAGEVNTIQAYDATPNGHVVFVYGLERGAFTIQRICPGVTLDIHHPQLGGVARADGEGNVTFERPVSPIAEDVTVYFQAIDVTTCETSPVVVHHFPVL